MSENPYEPPANFDSPVKPFTFFRRFVAIVLGLIFLGLLPCGLEPWRVIFLRLWDTTPKRYVIPTSVLFPTTVSVDLGLLGLHLIAFAFWKGSWTVGRWGMALFCVGLVGGSMPMWMI